MSPRRASAPPAAAARAHAPRRRRSPHDALNLDRARWPWLLPLGVAVFMFISPMPRVERAIGVLGAMVVVVIMSKRPDRALLALLAFLPFYTVLFAWAYRLGVPWNIIRPLSLWKEAMLLAVVVAGFRGYVRSNRRFDLLDKLAFAYIGCVLAYLVAPGLFSSVAPLGASVRFVAFRAVALFVILLLGARHAELPADLGARALRVVTTAASIVAAIGLFEFFFDATWNDFLVNRIQFTRYAVEVLDIMPLHPFDYRWHGNIGSTEIIRIGSVLLSPLACGFYLLVGFGAAIEQALRRGARPSTMVSLGLIATGLLLTQTRSALIGALVVAVLALRPAAGRRPHQRIQFALILAAILMLALPAAFATGLSERAKTATTGEDESAVNHIEAFWDGLDEIGSNPLGKGLGTGAGAGQRFSVQGTVVSENNYLQIGNEMGVVTMAVFIAFTVSLCVTLRRRARSWDDVLLAAMSGTAVGLAVGAFFLHVWNDLPVAWSFFGLAGAALSRSRSLADEERQTDHLPIVAGAYAGPTSLGRNDGMRPTTWNSAATS